MALGLGGMLGSFIAEWYFTNNTNDRDRRERLRSFFGWLKLLSGGVLLISGAGLLFGGAITSGAVAAVAGVVSIASSRSGGRRLLK